MFDSGIIRANYFDNWTMIQQLDMTENNKMVPSMNEILTVNKVWMIEQFWQMMI